MSVTWGIICAGTPRSAITTPWNTRALTRPPCGRRALTRNIIAWTTSWTDCTTTRVTSSLAWDGRRWTRLGTSVTGTFSGKSVLLWCGSSTGSFRRGTLPRSWNTWGSPRTSFETGSTRAGRLICGTGIPTGHGDFDTMLYDNQLHRGDLSNAEGRRREVDAIGDSSMGPVIRATEQAALRKVIEMATADARILDAGTSPGDPRQDYHVALLEFARELRDRLAWP